MKKRRNTGQDKPSRCFDLRPGQLQKHLDSYKIFALHAGDPPAGWISKDEFEACQAIQADPEARRNMTELLRTADELARMHAGQPRISPARSEQSRHNPADLWLEGLRIATSNLAGAIGQWQGRERYPDDPERANAFGELNAALGEIALGLGEARSARHENDGHLPGISRGSRPVYTPHKRDALPKAKLEVELAPGKGLPGHGTFEPGQASGEANHAAAAASHDPAAELDVANANHDAGVPTDASVDPSVMCIHLTDHMSFDDSLPTHADATAQADPDALQLLHTPADVPEASFDPADHVSHTPHDDGSQMSHSAEHHGSHADVMSHAGDHSGGVDAAIYMDSATTSNDVADPSLMSIDPGHHGSSADTLQTAPSDSPDQTFCDPSVTSTEPHADPPAEPEPSANATTFEPLAEPMPYYDAAERDDTQSYLQQASEVCEE